MAVEAIRVTSATGGGPGPVSRLQWNKALLLAALPGFLTVVAVAVVPILWLFILSFYGEDGLSLEHYRRMLENGGYGLSLRTTFQVAAIVTICCAILGYPVAYLIASLRGRRAVIVLIIVLLPLWTSLLVRTFAWMILLQRRGLINQALTSLGIIDEPLSLANDITGTVIGMTHVLLPFMILPLLASMRAIDGRLVHAATSLGASPPIAFRSVFFRLSLPGLFAGITLTFISCLGYYVMPALLGGGRVFMWAMKIESNINQYPDWGAASAMGVVLLLVTAICLSAGRYVAKKIAGDGLSWAGGNEISAAKALRSWPALLAAIPVLAFLLLPTMIVIPMSFSDSANLRFPPQGWSLRWYYAFFASPDWTAASVRSFAAALLTAVLATPAGLAIALWLRERNDRFSHLVRALIAMPLIVPTILMAIGVFFLYARLSLNGTLFGLVLAHIALALPFVLITIEAGLRQSDLSLERAAQSLGASPFRAILTTTVPQIRISLLTAWLFAFLTSFDEIVIAYFISSGDRSTLPRRMFSALRDSFDPTIAAISTMLIFLSVAVIAVGMVSGDKRSTAQ